MCAKREGKRKVLIWEESKVLYSVHVKEKLFWGKKHSCFRGVTQRQEEVDKGKREGYNDCLG